MLCENVDDRSWPYEGDVVLAVADSVVRWMALRASVADIARRQVVGPNGPDRPDSLNLAPRPGLEPGTCGLAGDRGIACIQRVDADSVPQFPEVTSFWCPESADSRIFCGTEMKAFGAFPGRCMPLDALAWDYCRLEQTFKPPA